MTNLRRWLPFYIVIKFMYKLLENAGVTLKIYHAALFICAKQFPSASKRRANICQIKNLDNETAILDGTVRLLKMNLPP